MQREVLIHMKLYLPLVVFFLITTEVFFVFVLFFRKSTSTIVILHQERGSYNITNSKNDFERVHSHAVIHFWRAAVCVLQNTQRISSSQSTQPLATPVVSVTTPSLPPQGLMYSGMPTTYNPAGECNSCRWRRSFPSAAEMWALTACGRVVFWQSSPWAAQRSPPCRASALPGSRWAPCRHGNSISLARQLLILWCE